MKILLTTTSFQDTPGAHHDLLAKTGWEIIRARGPLNEADTLALVGDIGYICGDDAITRKVLEKARPKLKVLSKYGIGVDKIDVKSATEFGIPLLFTPGVNHTAVAEHNFMLLLALEKNFLFHLDSTRSGDAKTNWQRKTGHELLEKTIGIIGMGRIGREVAIRAKAFGMKILGFDLHWDEKFAAEHGLQQAKTLDDIYKNSDYISLHTNLTPETQRHDQRQSQLSPRWEERRFDSELRARRNREHQRHGRRPQIRPGRGLRHGCFGRRTAACGPSAAQTSQRRLHAACRLSHLRERRAPGDHER